MSSTPGFKAILEFMTKENRPFTASQVAERSSVDLGKATVVKILDALVDKNKIKAKEFGKMKVYYPIQSTDLATMKVELRDCQQRLMQSQLNVSNKETRLRELEAKLKVAAKVRTLSSLEEERSQLLDEIRDMNEKLRQHETMAAKTNLTPADAKRIEKSYKFVVEKFRERKKQCNHMISVISEHYPKSKQVLLDAIGIETDEAAGFDLNLLQY